MTPDSKAKELIDKFSLEIVGEDHFGLRKINAKQCAILCADEILEAGAGDYIVGEDLISGRTFWQQVKQSIQSL